MCIYLQAAHICCNPWIHISIEQLNHKYQYFLINGMTRMELQKKICNFYKYMYIYIKYILYFLVQKVVTIKLQKNRYQNGCMKHLTILVKK